jgi:UDP-4-amino-4,6-dideoxy-N-acetyl-beta-L-altrosamine transaminase
MPYGKQYIDDDDVGAVVHVLKSDHLTQGSTISEFEKAICDYTGAKYCVVFSSATAALHLAVNSLNIEFNSEGITSPNSFVASANCLVYNNIKPVFADINPYTFNIDPIEIEKKITKKTKVVIPVHFAGRACDMSRIREIVQKNKLYIIEDAAHAIGSSYEDGGRVGNCKYSDMTVFSFHPVKTMTTGEGGAVTTNKKEFYEKLVLLRSHGITKEPSELSIKDAPWYYEMQDLGYNYRMTDIQAALGLSQLKKLEKFKHRRIQIVETYNSAFSGLSYVKIPTKDTADSCFHLYVIQINFDMIGKSRKQVMDFLREKNIGTQVHYIPVHTQPYYRSRYDYKWGDFPKAECYYAKALSIPLYYGLSETDQFYIVEKIGEIFK